MIYKDADKKELKLERIASKYAKSKNKRPYVLKLAYNEHLADIDIVYTFDSIKYIEIVTSKGQFLKAGIDIEDGYTSISKIDVNQKSYMPIVAFETTFTKDGLKEIFVYRSPVRFSKKRKRRALTVNEINSLKAAPNLESLKKAQKNLELIRNITKKSIMQLKILNQFKSLASKSESPGTNVNEPSLGGLLEPTSTKVIKEDQYMEDQEFGIDHEQEDEEQKLDNKSSPMKDISKKISSAPFNFINLFKRKESTHSSTHKEQGSRENSPEPTFISPARPKALNIFSLLRFNSLKKVIGVGSPHTGGSLSKNQSTPGQSATNTPKKRRGNRSKSNIASPGLREPPLRKKATIEEALGNLDSDDDEDKAEETPKVTAQLARQNTRRHTVQSPSAKASDIEDLLHDTKPFKKVDTPKKIPSPRQSQKFSRTSILAHSGQRPSIQSKDLPQNTSSSDSSSDSDSQGEPNVKTFTDAIERYEIASKMSSLLNLQNVVPKPKANSGAIGLKEKRVIGMKRYSAAEFMKPSLGLEFNAAGITRSKVKAASRLELGQSEIEAKANAEHKKNADSRRDLDSAMKKILSNVADKKYEQQPEAESAKLPIRRSAAKESKTTMMKSPMKSVTGKKNTFFGD